MAGDLKAEVPADGEAPREPGSSDYEAGRMAGLAAALSICDAHYRDRIGGVSAEAVAAQQYAAAGAGSADFCASGIRAEMERARGAAAGESGMWAVDVVVRHPENGAVVLVYGSRRLGDGELWALEDYLREFRM
ncbi:MAG TPA: hypothetical protein VMV33_17305 [Rhodocyclaceae bacterium]|nr:hypothetical protein [Rhodocyclaceae bacterium]